MHRPRCPAALVELVTGRPFYLQAAVWDGAATDHPNPMLMTVFR